MSEDMSQTTDNSVLCEEFKLCYMKTTENESTSDLF